MKEKIVFFGSSSYVFPIIDALQKNFDLKQVITTENNPTDAVPKFCIENKIPYISITNLNDPLISSRLSLISAPVAVLADFGLIIPKEILNAFPKGIINIHPSFLPKYRGPTPVQTAILNGEKETGVSIIKLDDEVDHGPILFQEKEEILSNDTSASLYKRLFEKGANLLIYVLDKYLREDLKPIAQNHQKATFTKRLTREDGFVDLMSLEIRNPPGGEAGLKLEISRKIRAYFPWPGVYTKLKINNKELRVKLLPEEKIQVEGKRPMIYKDFINGYPKLKNIIQILEN